MWMVCPGGARKVHGLSSEPQSVSSVTMLARYWSTPDSTGTVTEPDRRHLSSLFDTTAQVRQSDTRSLSSHAFIERPCLTYSHKLKQS